MAMLRRCVASVVTATAVTGGSIIVSAAPVDAAVVQRLKTAIADLPVAGETRDGYGRAQFRHWLDGDHDCQDTRDEVLAAESKTTVTGCDITAGRWISYYDRATWTEAPDVDIDHLVPLAEAWDSGAKKWNADTRARYANDLADPRTLVAVTDNVNQAKGDRDPAEWLPRYSRCTYIKQWVAVKIRWSLRVNPAEKKALARVADGCTNTTITVTKARISLGSTSSGAGSSSGTDSSGGGTGGATDPRFDYCYNATAAGYGPYYRGTDPEYYWYRDADDDGVVCE